MSLGSKRLRIYKDLETPDWFSFNQGYAPLLSNEASNLYTSFYFQKIINQHLNIENYNLKKFLENYQLTEESFKEYFTELEKLNLVKLSIKNNLDSSIEFSVKLERVKTIGELLKDLKFNEKLKNTLTIDKYAELRLITEDIDVDCEISLDTNPHIEKEPKNILDSETYQNFYNGVFQLLNSEFSLSDDVLRLVRDYHIVENKVSLEKIQQFAYLSIKEKSGKFFICHRHLSFLINQELRVKQDKFDSDRYDNFWRNLLFTSNQEIDKEFKELFSSFECNELYKKLTNKDKVPATLSRWIRDCIQNKDFTFPVLNATVSFVKTLLKKVPVNYLSKLTDTLSENEYTDPDLFLTHIKDVITNDIENKNRIGISTEVINSKEDKKKQEDVRFQFRFK